MPYISRDGEIIDGDLPEVPDPLLEKLKNTFLMEFSPTKIFQPGVILMSSNEIYVKWQALYNSISYSPADIATWLHEKGFEYIDAGQMQYEWLLMPATCENN